MARVTGIYRLGLDVPDLARARDFYSSHGGMILDDAAEGEACLRSRAVDHADLLLRAGARSAINHIALSVASEDDLYALLSRVTDAGFNAGTSLQIGSQPNEKASAVVHDADGNRVVLVVHSDSATKSTVTEPGDGPLKLGHVVVWSSQPARQEAFYGRLGFQVTDRTHAGMSFLRCNADHHTIAFLRSSHGRTGLQHAAFDLGTLDAVMRKLGRLKSEGIACIWGVGRHGPGNNVFSYYRDPAGNIVEYFGDMERVSNDAPSEVRHWGPEHKGDTWGVSGPAPPPFHDAPA